MPNKPYVVVVGSDFSAQAARALQTAYQQAKVHAPAELHVVHASLAIGGHVDSAVGVESSFAGLVGAPVETLEELQAELVRHLDAQLPQLPGFRDSGVRVVAHALLEIPLFAITQLAEALQADLIVVGSHGRHGVARWLLGSVAEAVVRQAACPVLVVPPLPHELSAPAVQPPCAQCVEARQQSSGAEQWCAAHRVRHGRRHVYHQGDRVGADSNLPLVVHQS